MSTWVDVTCGRCNLWLGDARNSSGRMDLAISHFETVEHPDPPEEDQ